MIYVYTSIVNGWDNLRPPLTPVVPGVRYICFTDCPLLPAVAPWEFRPLYNVGPANITVRLPKILPHLMLPADAEYSIYHDGNFQLKVDPRELVETALRDHDWAAHLHPARACIYDEAAELLRAQIGDPKKVHAEAGLYQAAGYSRANGLWANGFMVRRHTQRVASLCEQWWQLFKNGCGRDQLSFPVARDAHGLSVASLRGDIYNSPFVHFSWHAAWITQESSVPFRVEREQIRTRMKALRSVAGESIPEYPVY